jgi:hypothetical protein
VIEAGWAEQLLGKLLFLVKKFARNKHSSLVSYEERLFKK